MTVNGECIWDEDTIGSFGVAPAVVGLGLAERRPIDCDSRVTFSAGSETVLPLMEMLGDLLSGDCVDLEIDSPPVGVDAMPKGSRT